MRGVTRAAAGAVLFREATRFSRRWQTWGLRLLFSAVVLGTVVFMRFALWLDSPDASRYAEYGRYTFWAFAGIQYALVALLAPVLASTGIIEEREEKTLDLLAISRLSPSQILWGKLASRLLVLMTIVAGTAPLLVMVSSMGGVGTADVVVAVAMTMLTAAMAGVVGGYVGLFAKNVVAPVIVAAIWGFGAWVALPGLYSGIVLALNLGGPEVLGHFSPPAALAVGGWWGLLPILTHLPVFLVVAMLAVPSFRYATSNSAWVGSREHRAIDRLQLFNLLGAFAVIAGLLPIGWVTVDQSLDPAIRSLVPALWGGLILYTWTGVVLHSAMQLLRTGAKVVNPADPSNKGRSRRVWGNPVGWRALSTRAHGPSWIIVGLTMLAWMGLAALLGWDNDLFEPGSHAMLMSLAFVPAIGFTAMAATGSMLEERREAVLSLLQITTFPSWRIVTGKLQGVALRTWPMLALAAFAVFTLPFWQWESWYDYYQGGYEPTHYTHGPYHLLVLQIPGARNLFTIAWLGSVWLATATVGLLVALLARPPRVAWVVNIVLVAGFFTFPFFLFAFEDLIPGVEYLQLVLFPIISDSWSCGEHGVPIEMVVSTVGYTALGLLGFAGLVFGVRRAEE